MTNTPMTEEEFAQKVQWEGGVLDALDYGLKAEHVVPGELHDLWQRLEDAYKPLRRRIREVEDVIDELAEPV